MKQEVTSKLDFLRSLVEDIELRMREQFGKEKEYNTIYLTIGTRSNALYCHQISGNLKIRIHEFEFSLYSKAESIC